MFFDLRNIIVCSWQFISLPVKMPGRTLFEMKEVWVFSKKWHQIKIEKNSSCLQWGSNSRPLVYETSALPLSYRGFLFLFHGNNMTYQADFTLFVICQIMISLKSLKQTYHWINELCHNGWDWSRKCLSHHDQSIVFAGIPERRKVIVSIQF